MQRSLRDTDVYNSDIRPYVHEKLRKRFPPQVVRELPIVASVNIAKKVVDSKANLYKNSPDREFTDLDESQMDTMKKLYDDSGFDSQMLWSNKYYELQGQTHVKIVPHHGKIKVTPLKNHQVNVVPYLNDPEEGEIFILSSFDKMLSELKRNISDGVDETIAEEDDYDPYVARFIVWSPSYHFVMDGMGTILTEEIENPISPLVPVIEIAPPNKDFEYWIKGPSGLSGFTVDFNEQLSMLNQIVELQGFAQAFMKAPKDLQPTTLSVGPHRILRLITDPDNPNASVEFGYANPSSDIANSQDFIQSILSQFLSSHGLDPSLITGDANATQGFSSGVERLLAMIDKFDASKDAQDIFEKAEQKIYKVNSKWINVLRDTDLLDEEYKMSEIPEDSRVNVEFNRPEAVQTEDEKLLILEKKIDMGLMSKVQALAEINNISIEEAREKLEQIEEDEEALTPVMPMIPPMLAQPEDTEDEEDDSEA
jgi:hypothetical protein